VVLPAVVPSVARSVVPVVEVVPVVAAGAQDAKIIMNASKRAIKETIFFIKN
jgi:hypothetical protein